MWCPIPLREKNGPLKQINHLKNYDKRVETVREDGITYLDWAGAALYDSKVPTRAIDALPKVTANPHSSQETEVRINEIRDLVKKVYGAHDYELIFTASASHGLDIVGSTFFTSEHVGPEPHYVYCTNNHTSVIGIRNYVWRSSSAGKCSNFSIADVTQVPESDTLSPVTQAFGNFRRSSLNGVDEAVPEGRSRKLLALPWESNFDGARLTTEQVRQLKERAVQQDFVLLLDGVKLPMRGTLDETQADFIPVSFYKTFGFPSGIGGLFVRKSAVNLLVPSLGAGAMRGAPFYGGTVDAYSPHDDFVAFTPSLGFFERGTLNFHGILMLETAIQAYLHPFPDQSLPISPLHGEAVALEMALHLKTCVHATGVPVIQRLTPLSTNHGPTIAFLVRDYNNRIVPYVHIVQSAKDRGIILRGGCFCNVGACMQALQLSSEDIQHFYNSGHFCSDNFCEIDGKPTGALRISFGRLSTLKEVRAMMEFLNDDIINRRWDPENNKLGFRIIPQKGDTTQKKESGSKAVGVSTVTGSTPRMMTTDGIYVNDPNGVQSSRTGCSKDTRTGCSIGERRRRSKSSLDPPNQKSWVKGVLPSVEHREILKISKGKIMTEKSDDAPSFPETERDTNNFHSLDRKEGEKDSSKGTRRGKRFIKRFIKSLASVSDTISTASDSHGSERASENLCEAPSVTETKTLENGRWYRGVVRRITIYPVKGTGGVIVPFHCNITKEGLAWDRRWSIMRKRNGKYKPLNFKTCPPLLHSKVICKDQKLYLWTSKSCYLLNDFDNSVELAESEEVLSRIEPSFTAWAEENLGFDDVILDKGKPNKGASILCVSIPSHHELEDTVLSWLKPVSIERFRSNILFDGMPSMIERKWTKAKLNDIEFDEIEECVRCGAIDFDNKSVFAGLRSSGTNKFGSLLMNPPESGILTVGMTLQAFVPNDDE